MEHSQFTFQRLEVYQAARAALALCVEHRSCWMGMPGEIGPQLERAMVSVVINIAEGAGRSSPADQKRHYQIARGSVHEVAGCLDIASLFGRVRQEVLDELNALLVRVAQMLTAMIRR